MASRSIVSSLHQQVLSHFPRKYMRMVFAYGSGVFEQQGHKDMKKNMLDYIFVVDNPTEWHKLNMIENSKHYSFLKFLGSKNVAKIQNRFGARVYFNTLVPCEDRLIKYGIIQTESVINDLFDWETLYISGRLHKPVQTIFHEREGCELSIAMTTNLNSAMHTALLYLDELFTEEELYQTITGLSYTGDFRMTVGEDKNKIQNIVKPNLAKFRELYGPILDSEDHLYWNKSNGTFEQSLHSTSQHHHLNLLPKMLQIGLVNHRNSDGRIRDTEEVLRSFAHDSECREVLEQCIHGIVKQSSWSQSAKGIFTAGLIKSVKYSASKLQKMWKSRKS